MPQDDLTLDSLQSGLFSIIAIILTLAAVLIVPIGLALTVLG